MIISSCHSKKKLVYFQSDLKGAAQTDYTPTLKTDDFLSIIVLGEDPLAVAPFNLPQSTTPSGGYKSGIPSNSGYLINAQGQVNLPIIGLVKLVGLNRIEAIKLLEEELSVYIKNPVVNLHILNFKITVLGEVGSPGTFNIPNERITILEAIGLAGDLKITGLRKNILVLRDMDGNKEEFRLDLTDTELFNSPAYYLQQNDVVYVEPNATSRTNSTIWKTTSGVFVSIVSLVITTIVLITK